MFSTQFRQSKTRNRSMPPRRRLADEILDHIVGIVGVADAVGAAQQHLQQDVRRALADQGQPLPRVFGQEPHGDVEGRPAPAFEREQLRQGAGIGAGDPGDVVGAHAGRKQRLMAVAHGRVGHEDALFGRASIRRSSSARARRAAASCRPAPAVDEGHFGERDVGGPARPAPLGLGMAVDGDVGEVGQELGRAVAAPDLREELRRRVDELASYRNCRGTSGGR